MKKLEIIIRPERLDDLKTILNSNGAHGLMISNIMDMEASVDISRFTMVLISVVIFFQRLRSNQLYQMRLTRQLLIR